MKAEIIDERKLMDKGIRLSWETWGNMRNTEIIKGEISYVKCKTEKGFERVYSVNIKKNEDYKIQEMISYMKAGLMPDSILITPDTAPANLGERLAEKGFKIYESEPCMLMYLEDFKAEPPLPPDFEITLVTNLKELGLWLKIVTDAIFERELVTLEQFQDVFCLEHTYFYLGKYKGMPVSACMTVTEGDTSVLEMVATTKEYRNRGYASALITKALENLKNTGIVSMTLRAEKDGIPLYKNLGFKTVFNRSIAVCDWDKIYRDSCPCKMEEEKIEMAKAIYKRTSSIADFIKEMEQLKIIGRKIWYDKEENAIYLIKRYAEEFGGGCSSNDSLIGKRCHCQYINHLDMILPISYCKCSAYFFEDLFVPLFGEKIVIEPVETVISGAEECIFRINL